MLNIYKSNIDGSIEEKSEIENNCWIDLLSPTEDEMQLVAKKCNVDIDFIIAALDEEELPRIEYDDEVDATLIIIKSPVAEFDREHRFYDTYPVGIIHCPIGVITVSQPKNLILELFRKGRIRTFFTYKKSRFIMQILYRNATLFLTYLRQIEKQSDQLETELHKLMKNRELILLLDLEKSLVYFSTALRSNEMVLRRLTKIRFMNRYEEDRDLLEDIVIENDQAIEMAKIYSDVLNSTMSTFASIISNNLNFAMKFLASVTIIMAIPTMISGFFGMNVKGIPFAEANLGFFIVLFGSMLLCALVALYMARKKLF